MIPLPTAADLDLDSEKWYEMVREADPITEAMPTTWDLIAAYIRRCVAAEKQRDAALAELQLAKRYINSKDIPLADAIQMIDEQREAAETGTDRGE